MPFSLDARLYAALDARMPIPRLNPERIWEEWQLNTRSRRAAGAGLNTG